MDLLNAVYLIINHVWRLFFHKRNAPEKTGPALWVSTTWKVLRHLSRHPRGAGGLPRHFVFGSRPDAGEYRWGIAPSRFRWMSRMDTSIPFKIAAAFVLVWTAPNVLQIFAKWDPTLSKPHRPGPRWTHLLQWEPTPAWGLAMGIIAALAVLAISGQTEFLYFRF